ncbi:MAG TPA: RNA 2',3'-cyclic phosphodiesterase [Longimicrobiales bacterium]
MRLFVAVNLPAKEQQQLAALLDVLRATNDDVRWLDPGSLHITLKFLGEVGDAAVPAVRAAVQAAASGRPAFDIELGGFGTFPSPARARVFWLGVQAPRELFELQTSVEQQLSPLGYATEKRRFQAHLTLGRAHARTVLDRAAVDRIGAHVGYKAKVRIDSLDLMRSQLSPRGARYERIAAAMLKT